MKVNQKRKPVPYRKPERQKIVPIRPTEKRPWYEECRIPDDIITEAQVVSVIDARARKVYAIPAPPDVKLDGDLFPYLDPEGVPQCFRVRRDKGEETRIVKGKKVKYGKYIGNAARTHQRILYIHPRGHERLKRKDTKILIVEAEKSVLSIEAWLERMGREDIVPVATGGCWGWKDGKNGVLPDLDKLNGRDVINLPDVNVHTNKDVKEAELQAIAEYRSRKCRAWTARIPQEQGFEGVNGPDDLLKIEAGDVLLTEILNNAKSTEVAPYSEHALAERFKSENIDNACYVPDLGWHIWDGKRWKYDDRQEVEKLCQQLCNTAAGERSILSEQNKLRSRKNREAVMREAQTHMAIGADAFDKDIWLLNTPDGTVDLRTGVMRDAKREDYCSKVTGVTPSVTMVPKRFHRFLREITKNDKDVQRYLQLAAGYWLTGSVELQELYFLFGTGSNGKGKYIEAIQGVLGEYSTTVPVEVLMVTKHSEHPAAIAKLRGARLAATTEVEGGSRWAEAQIKRMTGGDTLTARFMRQNWFDFMPQFKLVILGNDRPKLSNVGDAIRRRFRMIPFLAKFMDAKRDDKLGEKLKAEYPGILQWAIDGCTAWQRDGITPPKAVNDESDDYLESQDVLGAWIDECTEKNKASECRSDELYKSYSFWCLTHKEFAYRQQDFAQKLKERGFEIVKSHGIKTAKGLRLVPKKFEEGYRGEDGGR